MGAVFFEVLILEGIRKPVGREIMRTIELAIARSARRLMPFVMLLLYAAGFSMAWQYRSTLLHPFASSFALLLWTKIVLAISVLAHFITAMTLSGTGKLKSRHFQIIHLSVSAMSCCLSFWRRPCFTSAGGGACIGLAWDLPRKIMRPKRVV